jgi:hypothetical protein
MAKPRKTKKPKNQTAKKLWQFDLGDDHYEHAWVPRCFRLNNKDFKKEKDEWDAILEADAAAKHEDTFNECRTEVVPGTPVNEHVIFDNFYQTYEKGKDGAKGPLRKDSEPAVCSKNHILDPFVMSRLSRFIDMDRIAEGFSTAEEKLTALATLFRGDTIEIPLKKNYQEIKVRDFSEEATSDFERKLRSEWTDEDRRFADHCGGTLVPKNSLDSYLMSLVEEQTFKYPKEVFADFEDANITILTTENGPVLRVYIDTIDLSEVPYSTKVHSKTPDMKRPKLVPNIPVSIFENLDKQAMFEHFNIDPNPPLPSEVKEINMHESYAIIEQLQTKGRFQSEKFERLCQLVGSGYNFRNASDVMLAEGQFKGCTESALRKFFIREFEVMGKRPKGHNSKAG